MQDPSQIAIPMTAWQQAAIVVLFIILVFYMLYWFGKMQDKWQDFINVQDEKWRKWLETTNSASAAAMERVTKALDKLTEKLEEHDDRVMDCLRPQPPILKQRSNKRE